MTHDPTSDSRLSKLLSELTVEQASAVLEVLDILQGTIWIAHENALLDYYAHLASADSDLIPDPPDPPLDPDEDDIPF